MRRTIICIMLVTIAAVTSASTEDDSNARPKRDMAFIKNFITSTLFGAEEVKVPVSEQTRLFRIPGMNDILLKAVPKVNLAVEEAPLAVEHNQVDVHPSIALVSSYLGTKSLNETVTALEKVKILLESGVLRAQGETNVVRVPINIAPHLTETFEVIDFDGERPDCKFPSLQHVPMPYVPVVGHLHKPVKIPLPDLAFPTKYSYKQIHGDGVTKYQSNDGKNVIVTESKVPVPLPHYISSRFQEILGLGIHSVPFTPVPVVKQPLHNIPVNILRPTRVNPAISPNNYSYKHLHHDGSVTTYSGSGNVEQINLGKPLPMILSNIPPNVLIDKPAIIYAPPKLMTTSRLPTKVRPAVVPNDYSYKHLHNDGTVSTYTGAGVVANINERPTIVVEELRRPKPIPSVFTSSVPPQAIIEETIIGSQIPVNKGAAPYNPTKLTPTAVPSDYSYKNIHKDGTVTTYSGTGVVENKRPAIVVEEVRGPGPILSVPAHRVPPPAVIKETVYGPPMPVYEGPILHIPTKVTPAVVPTNYSYKHLHNDGTVTTHSSTGVVENINERPAIVVEEVRGPGPFPSVFADRVPPPAVIEETVYGPPMPVYEGPIPHIPTKVNPAVVPTNYSYKHLHNDGTVTTHSGTGVEENINQRPAIVVEEVRGPGPFPSVFAHRVPPPAVIEETVYGSPMPVYEGPIPHIPTKVTPAVVPTNYSYKHLHNDGTVTTHSGTGVVENINERPAIVVEEVRGPGPFPSVFADRVPPPAVIEETVYGPPMPVYEGLIPYIPTKVTPAVVPSNYSYKHLHNDGTVTTHSGTGVVENINERPAFVVEEVRGPGPFPSVFAHRVPPPAVIEETVYGPPMPVYEEAIPYIPTKVTPAVGPTDYSYKHLHNDGTVTTHSGTGVVENINERPAIVVEEVRGPGPFPSVFADRVPPPAVIEETVYGPPMPVYEEAIPYIPTKVTPAVGPTDYSYTHLHNDGTVTTHSGTGVVENTNDKPAIVVEEVRRPVPLPSFFANRIENIAATAHRLPPPIVMQETIHHSPISIHQESHPLLVEHLTRPHPKPISTNYNEEVKVNLNKNRVHIPTGFSYQTVHQDGKSTVHFGSGLLQKSNQTHIGTSTDANIVKNQESYDNSDLTSSTHSINHSVLNAEDSKDKSQKVNVINQTGGLTYAAIDNGSSTTTHSGLGKVQENPGLERKKSSGSKRRIVKLSRPRVRRLNNTKGAIDSDKFITTKPHVENIANKKGESNISTLTNDYTPSSITTGSTLTPVAAEIKKPVAGFSFKHTTNNGVFSNNNGEVAFQSGTKIKENVVANKEVIYTTEAAESSSAISLSANPIVVLPDEHVFSYKQDRIGSSVTVVADKANKVSVVEENGSDNFDSHRGDIPDTSYKK